MCFFASNYFLGMTKVTSHIFSYVVLLRLLSNSIW